MIVTAPDVIAPTGTLWIADYEIDTSNGITIEAGLGNDSIVIRSDLQTNIEVRGGAGTDSLQIYDRDESNGVTYNISSGRIYNSAGLDLGYIDDEIRSVWIGAGSASDTVNVNSVSAGKTLRIEADFGQGATEQQRNHIRIGTTLDLSPVQGMIDYEGGNGDDTAELVDTRNADDLDYEISTAGSMSIETVIQRENAGEYHFTGINTMVLRSGSGDSEFNVDGVDPSVSWDIFAGAGWDRMRLSPTDHRAN